MSALAALVGMTCYVAGARADEAAPSTDAAMPAAATALFDAGVALLEQKDYAAACPKLEASHRLAPAGGTVLNLAYCYERLGRLASAHAAYLTALDLALRAQPPREDRATQIRSRLRDLQPRLARLHLVPSEDLRATTGVRVELDGKRVDVDASVAVDAGLHSVRVVAPARRPLELSVSAGEEGSVVSVPLQAPSPDGAAIPSSLAPQPRPAPPRVLPYVVTAAAGGAVLAFGLVAGGIAIRQHAASTAACTDGCSSEGVRDEDSARTWAHVSTATVIGGAAVALLGAALWVFAATRKPASRAALQMPGAASAEPLFRF